MTNTVSNFESREAQLNKAIDADVQAILNTPNAPLPPVDADIVQTFVRKIEGSYNVERTKRDTDNAVDLLYIAYNTTPQKFGDSRVSISTIMNKLISLQQRSETTMREAMGTARTIVKRLDDFYPDWLDIKETADQSEIKQFVSSDLLTLAKDIRDRSLKIRDALLVIARGYDDVIAATVKTINSNEIAMGEELERRAELKRELTETRAKQAQVESLVTDLTAEVAEFEKKAREYEEKANTAEERAFIMSIIRTGAQMISNAIPAIAMAAAGPAGMLAPMLGGMMGGQGKATGDAAGGDQTDQQKSAAPQNAGDAAGAAGAKTKLSEQQAALKTSEADRDRIKAQIGELTEARKKLEASEGTDDPASPKSVQLAEMDKRIAAQQGKLQEQEKAIAQHNTMISSLQSTVDAFDKGLQQMSAEQQQQGDNLRAMQMKMIDRAEALERERRTQAADLVRLNAMLAGGVQQEEELEVSIRCLEMSVTALKRMKEIVEEMAFFFKSFADFMQAVADEAGDQIKSVEDVSKLEVIRKHRFAQLIRSVDEFFIRQTAQFHAASIVCDRFVQSFADGWSKLNKLSGDYITGERLKAYIREASQRVNEIVAERQAAADEKIATLQSYREQISKSA